MGRKCLLENFYFRFRNKSLYKRRKSTEPVPATIENITFPVWYYSPAEFSQLLKPWLKDPVFKPIGLFVPPSYINNYFSKSKVISKIISLLEKSAFTFPGLSDYSDHFLIETTKK